MADFYDGRWRNDSQDRWIVCDPSLDWAIDALPLEVRAGIRNGKNYTFAQVERIKALAREAAKNAAIVGE